MVKQSTKKGKKQEPVFAIARYFLKRNAHVVYAVRGSHGERYCTTIIGGKATGCTCEGNAKWHRRCRHMTQMELREAERTQRQVIADPIELTPVADAIVDANTAMEEHIETSAAVSEREAERKMADYRANVAYAILAHEHETHQHKPMPEARTDWQNCHGCTKRYYPKYEGQEFCERCDA